MKNINDLNMYIFKMLLSLITQMIKNLPVMQETWGSIPGLGRLSGEGNGNPLQYSCLENPMDRGAWWSAVHGVAKSRTWWATNTSHRPSKYDSLITEIWIPYLLEFFFFNSIFVFTFSILYIFFLNCLKAVHNI